jgi:hypothetical protein
VEAPLQGKKGKDFILILLNLEMGRKPTSLPSPVALGPGEGSEWTHACTCGNCQEEISALT